MAQLPFEDQISQEAPPVQDTRGLAEWLTRTVININGALRAIIERVKAFKIKSLDFLLLISSVDQVPTAIDAPMQISFGAASGTADDVLYSDAAGTIFCTEARSYVFELVLSVSRTGVPDYANLILYSTTNDAYSNLPLVITIDKPGDRFPFVATFRSDLDPGDYMKFYIVRDSAGSDSGGLYTYTPSLPGAPSVPSAWVRVTGSELTE